MDILNEVVVVERDIQKKLEFEEKKTRDWLDEVRRETEGVLEQEKERIEEACKRAIEDDRRESEKKAEEIIQEANAISERYEGLSDETLAKIIKKHLIRILPEKAVYRHDSQDVKDRVSRTKGTP